MKAEDIKVTHEILGDNLFPPISTTITFDIYSKELSDKGFDICAKAIYSKQGEKFSLHKKHYFKSFTSRIDISLSSFQDELDFAGFSYEAIVEFANKTKELICQSYVLPVVYQ